MLTGRDVFTTQVVALRHKGPLRPEVKTLAEMFAEGYDTTCVGFGGNPSSRGFDKVHRVSRLGKLERGVQPQGAESQRRGHPRELIRLARKRDPSSSSCATWTRTALPPPAPHERMFYHGNEFDKRNKSMEPVMAFKPFRDFLFGFDAAGRHRQ